MSLDGVEPALPFARTGLSAPALTGARQRAAIEWATYGLRRQSPGFSASYPVVMWQRVAVVGLTVALAMSLAFLPTWGGRAFAVLLAVPFVAIIVLRLLALWLFWRKRRSGSTQSGDRSTMQQQLLANRLAKHRLAPQRLADEQLPTYSILVPVYREADVVPGLVEALQGLDYPADKIEIFLITELDDVATRQALVRCPLSASMHVLTVPAGSPRTKPRALNFALAFASGALVAIYDAEDYPDAMQLRDAAATFAAGGFMTGCVQARLSIHNGDQSLVSQQFAFEYAALFDAVLPALHKLRLPIPLGGTSNHFRRAALLSCGGWDAFNVTEDADLGFRLARAGYAVELIESETQEEAPYAFKTWFGQRTRWLKGWMQTFLVHMRHPMQLYADLGWRGFWGIQLLLGGMVGSALLHPWIYAAACYSWWSHGVILPGTHDAVGQSLWALSVATLLAGYGSAAALTLATARVKFPHMSRWRVVALLPVYWLAISLAAYRALVDLLWLPYYWDKTEHSARPSKSVVTPPDSAP